MRNLILTITLLLTSIIICEAIPAAINYQGRLLQANGQPVNNGYVDVTVNLYDAETGGTKVYEEDIGQVAVVDSLYSFNFGTNTIDFIETLQNNDCWLKLEVNSLDMLPRKQLVSAPYALCAVALENAVLLTDETSIGVLADGASDGVAVGYNSDGSDKGVAVGYDAYAISKGTAIGYLATASDWGTAIGYAASVDMLTYGIAIGASAQATADNAIAIGYNTKNDITNTVRLRGMLYLDGGNNIYTRDTFGTGTWTPLVSGYTGVVTNFDGSATQLLHYTNGLLKAVH